MNFSDEAKEKFANQAEAKLEARKERERLAEEARKEAERIAAELAKKATEEKAAAEREAVL